MYICICNALNEKQIMKAINLGNVTPGQVYKYCGKLPQCGKCKNEIKKLIQDNKS